MGGIIKKSPKIRQAEPQEMMQEFVEKKAEKSPGGLAAAPQEERAAAATRRARRGGRRALLSAGRLGSGTEGGQATLGAG